MPLKFNIKGHWFHSRSSSSSEELHKIIKLVEASKEPRFKTLRWSGDKTDPLAVRFASTIKVNSSTMQTKIRAFIRYGFLKDKPSCPLEWSRLGQIWHSLKSSPDSSTKQLADKIEQLILASSLAIYSFDNTGYQDNPTQNFHPLQELINALDINNSISEKDYLSLVGMRNAQYWLIDLERSGLFEKEKTRIKLTQEFPSLSKAIKSMKWPKGLTDADWKAIHDNLLDHRNPLSEAIMIELDSVLKGQAKILPLPQQDLSPEIQEVLSDQEEEKILEINDYSVPDSFSTVRARAKQTAWGKIVKQNYGYKCCVPLCDVSDEALIEATHIKPYKFTEADMPHRANPSNGLCLCRNCHALFDQGLFTLTDDLKVQVSGKIHLLKTKSAKELLLQSENKKIKDYRSYEPSLNFIHVHRVHIFKK